MTGDYYATAAYGEANRWLYSEVERLTAAVARVRAIVCDDCECEPEYDPQAVCSFCRIRAALDSGEPAATPAGLGATEPAQEEGHNEAGGTPVAQLEEHLVGNVQAPGPIPEMGGREFESRPACHPAAVQNAGILFRERAIDRTNG